MNKKLSKKQQIKKKVKKLQEPKEVDEKKLLRAIKRNPRTLEELSFILGSRKSDIENVLYDLQDQGLLIYQFGDRWTHEKHPSPHTHVEPYVSRKDNTFVFGFCSDQHVGSKYFRQDVLIDLYDQFEKQDVDRVFNCGNFIDGEARFNKHDLLQHGMDNQIRELIRVYPEKTFKTYAISGDDHEGWYGQREGIDVGKHTETLFRDQGRTDWINLGYLEASMPLVNYNSRKKQKLVVMHPGGGSAYALSYKPQKIVESFEGGEKPGVLLIGHYHKLSYNVIRNVHCIQVGCVQSQSMFMRKKSIEAHVGGGICTLTQDPKTGAIIGCKVEFFIYFDGAYYNNRWSHSHDVNRPSRVRR